MLVVLNGARQALAGGLTSALLAVAALLHLCDPHFVARRLARRRFLSVARVALLRELIGGRHARSVGVLQLRVLHRGDPRRHHLSRRILSSEVSDTAHLSHALALG